MWAPQEKLTVGKYMNCVELWIKVLYVNIGSLGFPPLSYRMIQIVIQVTHLVLTTHYAL